MIEKKIIKYCFLFGITLFLFAPKLLFAQEANFIIQVLDTDFNAVETNSLRLPFDKINKIATLDIGGDDTDELVITPGQGIDSQVYLTRQDGSVTNSWWPYGTNFNGLMGVRASDLDNDGLSEIITNPETGGGPHIKIFDGFGKEKITAGFFADDKDYRGIFLVDVINYSKENKAIASLTELDGVFEIKIFSPLGKLLNKFNLPKEIRTAFNLNKIDLGGDKISEIAVSAIDENNKSFIYIFRNDGSLVNKFSLESFGEFRLTNLADSTGEKENILTITEKNLKLYNGFGKILSIFDTENDSLAALPQTNGIRKIIIIPKTTKTLPKEGKRIIIDVSEQKLSYYENGFRLASYPVSTGLPAFPTPLGEFAINNKIDRAYSKTYNLYMPQWMSFIGGKYGIHELPEWPNGTKEGEDHLGKPASHVCVRLGEEASMKVYDWADVGTKVVVQE